MLVPHQLQKANVFVCPRHIGGFWKQNESRRAQCLEQQHEIQVLKNHKNAHSAPKKIQNNKKQKNAQNEKIPKIQVIVEKDRQGELNSDDDNPDDENEDDDADEDDDAADDDHAHDHDHDHDHDHEHEHDH